MGKSRWPMNARAETSPANRAAPTTQAISTASVSGRHSRPCCVSAAEDGRRMEKKQVSGPVQTGMGRRMRTGGGNDDAARTHQPGEDKEDREGHVVSSPPLKPA